MQLANPEIRVDHNGLAGELNGRRIVASAKRYLRGERLVHYIKRVEFASATDRCLRFLMPAHVRKKHTEHSVPQRIGGVQCNGFAVGDFGGGPIPVKPEFQAA